MFELHCDELIRALSKRADSLCAKILIKMSKTNMDLNKAYVILDFVDFFFFANCDANIMF